LQLKSTLGRALIQWATLGRIRGLEGPSKALQAWP
jgi:hypothetical protein